MIATSPWPSLAPYPRRNLAHYLGDAAQQFPEKVAFIDPDGREYTYTRLWNGSRRFARFLQEAGIGKGQVIAILSPNCAEYVPAVHGSLLAGATITTLNYLYREQEVAHQLVDTDAVGVLAPRGLMPVVEAAKEDAPTLHHIWAMDDIWDMIEGVSGEPEPVEIDPEKDIAVLPYSSGTTGLPKGVMLSHYSMSANVRQAIGTEITNERSVVLDFLPYFHMYGMVVFLNACVAGGVTQIILPRFDPEQMLFLIQKHRVTDLFVVPPALLALLNVASSKSYDTSSLRFILSAAAPLAPELAEQGKRTFGCPVFQGYGMSEACALTNTNPLDRIKPTTGGAPVSDTIEKVVDLDTGEELPAGEVGELLIKAPQVMLGYWKRPDATAETLTEDGWLRTGDICSLDEDGYVAVLDRKKEMIKYKAYQVAPAELEGLLLEHPAVMDAAVIPKRDPEAGEIPKAFVVLRPDQEATKEQIMAFVAEKVAPYKKIRVMEFVQSIPKTISGKILRRELIEQERAQSSETS